jgi:hypothetical protein
MVERSPWALAALTLAGLAAASLVVQDPVDIVLVWVMGVGLVTYAVRWTQRRSATTQPAVQTPAPPAPGAPNGGTQSLRVLTAEEVGQMLRVEIADVIAAMSDGKLPGNNIAGEWRCSESALAAWLNGSWHG